MNKCWKCGKELNDENRSNVVYTSNPPKYTCTSCEEGKREKTDIWLVYYVIREKGGYAYEVEECNNFFASLEDANQFYKDLPKYIEKHFVGYELEKRSTPTRIGAICKHDRENLNVVHEKIEELTSDVKTVVSYIRGGVPGTSHTFSMKVFDFKIDTIEGWNKMMLKLEEEHPESKNSIIVIFTKELEECIIKKEEN